MVWLLFFDIFWPMLAIYDAKRPPDFESLTRHTSEDNSASEEAEGFRRPESGKQLLVFKGFSGFVRSTIKGKS